MSEKKIYKIAEEKAFDYQRNLGMIDSVSDDHVVARRMGFYDGFIAGAEWQKEQDQPITGNSLEQEWLRYVDKKKKENRGELPFLGEYGWLQIARHFAEWQKEQMMKDIRLAYGKVSMNPFDCPEAFEELINKYEPNED